MVEIKYPDVIVQLIGEDGNAFAILGRCAREARRAGVDRDEVEAFKEEAMKGDYNHLLRTCMRWFNCTSERE
tara:strand:- start:5300 stop:5515 length:216 start_codon:yes stop_codon:yes gene_type:complete